MHTIYSISYPTMLLKLTISDLFMHYKHTPIYNIIHFVMYTMQNFSSLYLGM